ncbi:MAG: tetratricopeptide repeat protein [Rhodocyclaceae bacterium]|nr:tetratricopeptide repeat protein [Rhodocyclaceae bacterium]
MAAFDLEEQEQLSQLKAWWEEYGKKLVALGFLVLLAVIGRSVWQNHRDGQASEASALYASVLTAEGNPQQAREAAGRILQNYDATAYAYLGALAAGKIQAKADDLQNAASQLSWVVSRAPEASVRDIARLRLAALQFDQADHAAALATLAATPVEELAAGFADLRGDILAADGKLDEARTAYRAALESVASGGGAARMREIVQVKLDALGEAR